MEKKRDNKQPAFWAVFGFGACLIILGLVVFKEYESASFVLSTFGGVFVASSLAWIIERIFIKNEQEELQRAKQISQDIDKEIYALNNLSGGKAAISKIGVTLHELVSLLSPLANDKTSKHILVRKFIDDIYDRHISRINQIFSEMNTGVIRFIGEDSIDKSTKLCYEKAKTVFAISWPEIDFWNGRGQTFLETQKNLIGKKELSVERFFIIREDHDEDKKVLEDQNKLSDLAEVLMNQIENGIKVYIAKSSDLKIPYYLFLDPDHKNNNWIPDFSIFDDRVSSTWIDNAYPTIAYNNGKKAPHAFFHKDVVIDYQGNYFKDAERLKNHLEEYRKSYCINCSSVSKGELLTKIKFRMEKILKVK